MAKNILEPSPGNAYSQAPKDMKIPAMDFIYRLECEMAKDNHHVGAPFGGSEARTILPIVGGTVQGPRISGTIQHMSGADWLTAIKGTSFKRLNARYTLRTNDGYFIYVKSKGISLPKSDSLPANNAARTTSQEDVDWFTRLEFEAGPGPYNWMNSVFAIGVLTKHDGKIIIDAYRLTNSPDVAAKDIKASL